MDPVIRAPIVTPGVRFPPHVPCKKHSCNRASAIGRSLSPHFILEPEYRIFARERAGNNLSLGCEANCGPTAHCMVLLNR